MLGKWSAVLKLVMMFDGKANESSPKPAGPLKTEALPACPEDPRLDLPRPPHSSSSLLISLPFLTHCDVSYLFCLVIVRLFFHQQSQ